MQRPSRIDIALALGLGVAGQVNLWLRSDGYFAGGVWAIDVALTAAMAAAVAWRLAAPLPALGAAFLCFPVARALGAAMTFWGDFVPFFVIVGSAAYAIPDRRRYLALVVPVAGFLLALGHPGTRTFNDVAFYALVLVVSWTGGDALRRFRERALVLARRTVELEYAAEAAIAEERTRIARELHDVISHNVSVAVVQAAGAERVLAGREPQVAEALTRVQEAGREALGEMQLLLGVLREDGREDGRGPRPSLARLESLVGQVREAGVAVELVVEGERQDLPAPIDLSAYRIVQEALTNVVKHAPGASATVTVRRSAGALELVIADQGASQHPARVAGGGGHGLVGMRERVNLHDGRLQAGPRRGGGFVVHATLPLAAA